MNHNPQVISHRQSCLHLTPSARREQLTATCCGCFTNSSTDSPRTFRLRSLPCSTVSFTLLLVPCSSRVAVRHGGSLDSHLDVAAGVGIRGVLAVPALLIPSTHDVRTPSGLVSIPGSEHAQTRATQKTSESAISETAGPEPQVPRLALRISANQGPSASQPRGMRLPFLDVWLSCALASVSPAHRGSMRLFTCSRVLSAHLSSFSECPTSSLGLVRP